MSSITSILAMKKRNPGDINRRAFDEVVAADPKGTKQLRESQTIDVATTFQNMEQVASLLQVAYAASGHFPCSVPIMKIMSQYQSVVTETETCISDFVNQIVIALKKQSMAVKFIEKKNDIVKALKKLSECAEQADEMAKKAEDMSKKAQELIDLSEAALVSATSDKSITDADRKKVQDRMSNAKTEADKLKKLVDQLAVDEARAAEEAREYAKKADKERERAFTTGLIQIGASVVESLVNLGVKMTPAGRACIGADAVATIVTAHQQNPNSGTGDDKANTSKEEGSGSGESNGDASTITTTHSTTLDDLEVQANKQKWEIREKQREANAELTGVLTEMEHLSLSKDDLQLAIKALETTIWAMGKVKTTFDRTKQFWSLVQDQCKHLADTKDIPDSFELSDGSEEMVNVIKEYAAYWIELGCLNVVAHNAIKCCTAKMHKFMEDLPTGQEARQKMVKEASDKIRLQIAEEEALNAEEEALD